MNENENELSHYQAQDTSAMPAVYAPTSLLPVLLTRLGIDDPHKSKQGAIPSFPVLRTALTDHDWTVRVEAVQELEHSSDTATLPLLFVALHDEDSSVRATAVRVLGICGQAEEQSAFEHLEMALHDPEWHVRETAVYALGLLGGQAALVALKNVLHDPDAAVRRAAQLVSQRLSQEALHVAQVENLKRQEPASQSKQTSV